MFDTMITVVGNVVDSPRRTRVRTGSVTKFRIASTARRFDSAAQRFVDADTFYVDVECWGDLSDHVSGSVSAGDPLVVVGAISTDQWETDAGRRSKAKIRARAVGHNLHWGVSAFRKLRRPEFPSAGEASAEPAGGVPGVDLADEEYAGVVDERTGELLDRAPGAPGEGIEEILRGRDYVTESATLHGMTTDALSAEPAHA